MLLFAILQVIYSLPLPDGGFAWVHLEAITFLYKVLYCFGVRQVVCFADVAHIRLIAA
jgi:hypothetical protein